MNDGDSGAWVVHHAGSKLYGHVVAADGFGDAYILPAPDTFANIRNCMGAVTVTLPDEKDFKTNPNSGYDEQFSKQDDIISRNDLSCVTKSEILGATPTSVTDAGRAPPKRSISFHRAGLRKLPRKRLTTLRLSQNRWPAEFLHSRPFQTQSNMQEMELLLPGIGCLESFLTSFDTGGPSFQIESIREHCRKIPTANSSNQETARAWVDVQDPSTEKSLRKDQKPGPLTSSELEGKLRDQVSRLDLTSIDFILNHFEQFGESSRTGRARRLMFGLPYTFSFHS